MKKDVGDWNFTKILIGYFEVWAKEIRRKEGKPREIPQPGGKDMHFRFHLDVGYLDFKQTMFVFSVVNVCGINLC